MLVRHRENDIQDPAVVDALKEIELLLREFEVATGAGEINTSSNVGTGAGLAKAKVVLDLPFKSIIAGNYLGVTENTNDITLDFAIEQTPIEIAVGVTPVAGREHFAEGVLWRYGMAIDGSSGVNTAWIDADKVSDGGGTSIIVPRTPSPIVVTSTLSCLPGTDIEGQPGSHLHYTGAPATTILELGGSTTLPAQLRHWTGLVVTRVLDAGLDETDIGIRVRNCLGCVLEAAATSSTIPIKFVGENQGVQFSVFHITSCNDGKKNILITNNDTGGVNGFTNSNILYLGRLTWSSAAQTARAAQDRYAIYIDSEKAIKSPPNSNLFFAGGVEVNSFGTGVNSRPIYVNYGLFNKFHGLRDEANGNTFMETNNDAEWNTCYDVTNNALSSVLNSGDTDNNFVFVARDVPFDTAFSNWQGPSMPETANEYDGAGQVYVPSYSLRNSSNGNENRGLTLLVVNTTLDYLEIPATRGVGVMVSTKDIKRFMLSRDAETGFGGRVNVMCYDSTQTQLDEFGVGHPYVKGTGAQGFTIQTNNGYGTGGDSDSEQFFSVGPDVEWIWVGIFGGTAVARIRSFSLQGLDRGAITVKQGFDDVSGDPFANDDKNYAIAFPVTVGLGIDYHAGDILWKDNAIAGDPLFFRSVLQGNPGVWETVTAGGDTDEVERHYRFVAG